MSLYITVIEKQAEINNEVSRGLKEKLLEWQYEESAIVYLEAVMKKHGFELVKHTLSYDEALKLFNKRNGFDIPNKLDEVKEIAKKMGVII